MAARKDVSADEETARREGGKSADAGSRAEQRTQNGEEIMEEQTQNTPVEAQDQPVGDDAMTFCGLTVGQITEERNKFFLACKEYEETVIPGKDAQLLRQSDRIVELETAAKRAGERIAELTKRAEAAEAQAGALAVRATTAMPAMERMPDGSLRLMVTVPEEQAIPLLSWAEGAQAEPQAYIQQQLEEALVAVVSS
jgi:hypothetical protein